MSAHVEGEIDIARVDDALLDLEGVLLALDMVRIDKLCKPGPEFHALAVLSKLAVEQAAKIRLAIFPETPKHKEASA